MQDLLLLDVNQTPIPPLSWPCCPTPIHIDLLMWYLSSHLDQTFASYVYTGLSKGFHIGFNHSSTRLQSASRNHPFSLANPTVVENHIATEVLAGQLVGPVAGPLTPLIHVSPLGLVPKSHQVDQWRMIVDLSFPHGSSVNDSIPPELCSLAYASVDDAVEHILHLGRSAQMVKTDLKDAYRMVPIHPHDQSLLGISWQAERMLIEPSRLASGLHPSYSLLLLTYRMCSIAKGSATNSITLMNFYSWGFQPHLRQLRPSHWSPTFFSTWASHWPLICLRAQQCV